LYLVLKTIAITPGTGQIHTVERYSKDKTHGVLALWKFNHKCTHIPPGKNLRIETLSPAVVHWSLDGWQSVVDLGSKDSGLGIYFTDLDTARLKPGAKVDFTFYWPDDDRWEGTNYTVEVESVA
jgi:glucoamylase